MTENKEKRFLCHGCRCEISERQVEVHKNQHGLVTQIEPESIEPENLAPQLSEKYWYCGKCKSILPGNYWHWCNETEAHSGENSHHSR